MSSPVSATFKIKRHARRPYLRLLVKDSDGNPFDFTGALSAKFQMKNSDGTMVITDGAGEIESPATSGVLRYEWEPGDTDTAGDYYAEFDVSYAASDNLTLPIDGDLLVKIKEDVNDA